MVQKATLKNQDLENQVEINGYAIVKSFLNKEEVNELFGLYESIQKKPLEGDIHLWNSIWHISPEESEDVSRRIMEVTKPKMELYFDNYECPVGTFLSKLNHENSDFGAHRDFSVLNEAKHEYRNCWIPLVDMKRENGMLYVFKGSHKAFPEILPMLNTWPHEEHIPELMKYARFVEVEAGDLVVYKDKTLHGSLANVSGKDRPVVHYGALPKDFQLVFYYRNEETMGSLVEMYEVPPDFYFITDLKKRPTGVPLVKKFHLEDPSMSRSEFIEVCKKMDPEIAQAVYA